MHLYQLNIIFILIIKIKNVIGMKKIFWNITSPENLSNIPREEKFS